MNRKIEHQNDLNREDIRQLTADAIRQSLKARVVTSIKELPNGKLKKTYKRLRPVFISVGAAKPNEHKPEQGKIVVPYKVAQRLINMATQQRSKYIPNR